VVDVMRDFGLWLKARPGYELPEEPDEDQDAA
jgi:hypothetical protein